MQETYSRPESARTCRTATYLSAVPYLAWNGEVPRADLRGVPGRDLPGVLGARPGVVGADRPGVEGGAAKLVRAELSPA